MAIAIFYEPGETRSPEDDLYFGQFGLSRIYCACYNGPGQSKDVSCLRQMTKDHRNLGLLDLRTVTVNGFLKARGLTRR